MSLRIITDIKLAIFEDAAEKKPIYGSRERSDELIISNMQRMTGGKFSIAASATEALALGDVASVRALWLVLDGAGALTLNGSATALPLTPATTAGSTLNRARFFIESTITSASVENTSATTAITGSYVVWGDPTT